jgi:hypothetical protein
MAMCVFAGRACFADIGLDGTDPIYKPAYYDPSQPAGSRWTQAGMENGACLARMAIWR